MSGILFADDRRPIDLSQRGAEFPLNGREKLDVHGTKS